MKRSIRYGYFLIFSFLLLASCSGTKHLPPGEKLYTGAETEFESTNNIRSKMIKTTVENSIRPKPNKKFLGMRPKLWMHNAAGETPDTKIKKWLKKRGEAPVLLSNIKPGVTAEFIDAGLFNIGIFNSFTNFEIVEKKHTAKIIYTSYIHQQYIINDFTTAISDDSLRFIILKEEKESLIKPGKNYNLATLEMERNRIDAILKNNGYFYFDPDYLIFKADTSKTDQTIALRLTLKDSIPENALTVYRINKVFIDQNYSLNQEVEDIKEDTIRFENVDFVIDESGRWIKPKELLRSVYLRKNEIFSRENHNITLNRLISLDNYKFVRVKFSDSDTTVTGYLDVSILMTPMLKRTFRTEMEFVSKSNNFTGPRMNLSLQNRNTFNGAELLNINMSGSFEYQRNESDKNYYSYSINPQVELQFPRFITPFNIRTNSRYIPKTRFIVAFNYLRRVNYFDMKTFEFVYGYKWKHDIRMEHEFNPASVSYTSLTNISPEFSELLNTNPYLKKSYEEQFIAGGSYSFTFNDQLVPGKKLQYYFRFSGEIAGNALSLAKRIAGDEISSENPAQIAASVYSQFIASSFDGRLYYTFRDKNKFVLRGFAGAAKPYGNSAVMPYSKQFFSGGPNSIRAFHINSVGPGTFYQNPDELVFLQLGGDIKLEANTEYRFSIYRFLKGALFVDAGNVWLIKSNPANIGTPFSFSTFMKETAVGAGAGLRVDVSFFVLRFDLAMPLRKPWLPENERWVIDEIDFGSSKWRGENLILNVAIGYPF
jgi:outer membrane protein insertion porin family